MQEMNENSRMIIHSSENKGNKKTLCKSRELKNKTSYSNNRTTKRRRR